MSKSPLIFESIPEFISWRRSLDTQVGFVPTMGALHAGHESLLAMARENPIRVLSIYVNPTQFNSADDFQKYPQTLAADLELAAKNEVTAVLLPNYREMYSDNYRFKISENEFSKVLCGAHRPGHFDGVLTVVMKLLNIVSPRRAYFGEKDFQQLQLIKDMVQTFFVPVEIIAAPTLREKSGLAMSSRNRRLSAGGIEKAALIFKSLQQSSSLANVRQQLTDAGFDVDYVEDHFGRRFVAATLEGVRLIDNVKL
jgi:pantoate--beta-alanine ligase